MVAYENLCRWGTLAKTNASKDAGRLESFRQDIRRGVACLPGLPERDQNICWDFT